MAADVRVRDVVAACGEPWGLRVVAGAAGLDRRIGAPRIQQPGLALAGYLPQVHPDRVQVLGNSEIAFLETLGAERAHCAVEDVARCAVACFVVTNAAAVPEAVRAAGEAAGVPVLSSPLRTSDFIRAATLWLEERMAPEVRLHGDLMEVAGVGILILGRSGIGKSEAALDLLARGHRLVADDVVEVRRIGPNVLRGRGAALLSHNMEIRGLGILNVEELFGLLATLDQRQIDLVVELRPWGEVEDDRVGLEERRYAILGVELPLVRIPISPGRDLARIIEIAARSHLLKARGHHPARELAARVDAAIAGQRARGGGGGA
jgi:HPr kinase/phosphorylase